MSRTPNPDILNDSAEGITWISSQSLIQLRHNASQLLLDSSKIHAKQGGAYLSSFKGRGMEFDESRIYQAGDDIRNMDWRVTARTGTAHTKVFCEERERPVLIWLDLNASMMFATRSKYKAVVAAEVAALVAWSAAKNNDRVGGLIFSSQQHTEIKPRRGKAAVLDFIGRCSSHSAWREQAQGEQHDRDMTAAVSRLRKVTHPGSLIFMISDFRDIDPQAYSQIADIARSNDIIFINISDPIEVELPASGSYKLTDGVNQVQIQTSSKKVRDDYRQRYQTHSDKLKHFCRMYRIHLIDVSTQDDAFERLKNGLGLSNNSNGRGRHRETNNRRKHKTSRSPR
jgi:uncharacterized protein (DUF58 family)